MLNEGLNRIRTLVNDDMDKGSCGTGTNAAKESNTDLQTEDTDTRFDTTYTLADKQITKEYQMGTGTGDGNTYTEYKDYDSTNSNDYSRIVFTGIDKTTTNEILISIRYFFRNV